MLALRALAHHVQHFVLVERSGELAGEKGAALLRPIRTGAAEHVQKRLGDADPAGPEHSHPLIEMDRFPGSGAGAGGLTRWLAGDTQRCRY
jgi:hypothetical protein